MQFYALDQNRPILASEALKGISYFCPECFNPVRVRGGELRQAHFFHLRANRHCKQHCKSLTHLRLQQHIQSLFPSELLILEKAFPSIRRIADVADLNRKFIFEIQCSPISLAEAKKRTEDYESLGYCVIWILHDKLYNRIYFKPAEAYLRKKICYYTNMDAKGQGSIYDQYELCVGVKRIYRSMPCKVNLQKRKQIPALQKDFPGFLFERIQNWSVYHQGDLLDRFLNNMVSLSWLNEIENSHRKSKKEKLSLLQGLKRKYFYLLQLVLESVSR